MTAMRMHVPAVTKSGRREFGDLAQFVSDHDNAVPGDRVQVGGFADDAADDAVEAWQDRALCSQVDPETFFPEKGGSTREAKRICGACPVQPECRADSLARDERFGIWGGLSERDRRRIRRNRLEQAR